MVEALRELRVLEYVSVGDEVASKVGSHVGVLDRVVVGSWVEETVLVLLLESVGVRVGVLSLVGLRECLDRSFVAVGVRDALALRGSVGGPFEYVAVGVPVGRYTTSVDPVDVYGGIGSDDSPPYSQKYDTISLSRWL